MCYFIWHENIITLNNFILKLNQFFKANDYLITLNIITLKLMIISWFQFAHVGSEEMGKPNQ